MATPIILAKSASQGRSVSLSAHIRSVLDATMIMFGRSDSPTRLALNWLRFFRLPPDEFTRFYTNLWLAAGFHDLGKANDGFQQAVRNRGPQVIRHEHLSALLLGEGPLQAWMRRHADRGIEPWIVTSAVASHHLKVNPEELGKQLTDKHSPAVLVLADDREVAEVCRMTAAGVALDVPDVGTEAGLWQFHSRVTPTAGALRNALERSAREARKSDRRYRLLLAVKAALIAVDSAGSALPRTGLELGAWLESAFGGQPLLPEDIHRGVISPRVAELKRSGRWRGFHDFQVAADCWADRTLLLSGCGTGKTLAAWRWIAARLTAGRYTRALFLYPTRATATEGFRDYSSWAGPEISALVHGTSQYDLTDMFANPDDERSGWDYTTSGRLYALGYWHRRIFTGTIDTFLAAMSNRYAALCMLPVLAESVVVIDEVHSYDKAMFKALERFLKSFDIPVLCMTASLPDDRLATLRDDCGLAVFPTDLQGFVDLHQQENAPRYNVRVAGEIDCQRLAERSCEAGLKVLWVSNTVARCQRAARWLSQQGWAEGTVICYHSRFRLMDRNKRHEEAIRRFKDEVGPLLLVTTQVCEMSLDLDADVLITEAAPVPALIQRMGRCCREPIPRAGRRGEVCICRPEKAPPYTDKEIEQGVAFGAFMAGTTDLSQAHLSHYLAELDVEDPYIAGGFTGFLDSKWYAMAKEDSFREDDDFTTDCILDADIPDYLGAKHQGRPEAPGFVLPAPKRLAVPRTELGKFLMSVPAARYSAGFGLSDRPLETQ